MRRRIQLLHNIVNGEAGRLLARRELLKCRKKLADIALRRNQQERMVHPPIPVRVRGDRGPLIRIHAQVEKPRYPRIY